MPDTCEALVLFLAIAKKLRAARDLPNRRERSATRPRKSKKRWQWVQSAKSKECSGSITTLPSSGAMSNNWAACDERAGDSDQMNDSFP